MSIRLSFNSLFEAKTLFTVILIPDKQVTVGRIDPSKQELKDCIYLDSKVISRVHATIKCSENGKVLIQDAKSSAGTFLNSIRLSPPRQESEFIELKDGDVLQFGEDCEYNGVLYKAVLFRVSIEPLGSPMDSEPPKSAQERADVAMNEELTDLWAYIKQNYPNENPLIHSMLDRITQLKSSG
jgi:pSer/pThr/pTyr-binding forkhead associated (FHA) protein